jgi:hypothetical protein
VPNGVGILTGSWAIRRKIDTRAARQREVAGSRIEVAAEKSFKKNERSACAPAAGDFLVHRPSRNHDRPAMERTVTIETRGA